MSPPTSGSQETVAPSRGARRLFRRMGERPTAFTRLHFDSRSVSDALAVDPGGAHARVFVLGPRPGQTTTGFTAWADGPLPPGYSVDSRRGHYLEGEHPALRFVHEDGSRVEVLRAAQWFGDAAADATAEDAAVAWDAVTDELRRGFDREAVLLTSPAATGRELFVRTIPRDVEWFPLPDDLQRLIRSTSGQGRVQLLHRDAETVPGLVGYDGRFMYAALCWGLAGGGAELRACGDYLGQTRARYHARATVPRDWHERCKCGAPGHAGIGLLGLAAPVVGDGWAYPAEPGQSFWGWWDGAEVAVALNHGWRVDPDEAIVFDQTPGVAPPLDGWAKRLVSVRERLRMRTATNAAGIGSGLHSSNAALTPNQGALCAAAVRSIVLHAIGAFHGSTHRVTRSVPIDAETTAVPDGARDLRVEGDRVVWAEHHDAAWPELSHPEWSAAIWARARARLLSGPGRTGALHVPARDVLAFRTDALYLTADPDWPDDGKVGRLRRTIERRGPLATPRTHAELLEVVK